MTWNNIKSTKDLFYCYKTFVGGIRDIQRKTTYHNPQYDHPSLISKEEWVGMRVDAREKKCEK